MNKYIIFLCTIGLYAPYIDASFPGSAGAGAGQGAAQQAISSPLAKLHAKQSSENKLIPWPSIIASLLPLKLVPSKILQHKYDVWSVAWNNDDTYLATASEYVPACIWNTKTGKSIPYSGPGGKVLAVAWDPKGTHLASGSKSHFAFIWNTKTNTSLHTLYHSGIVSAVAWNPGGTHLATGSYDKTACIWNAQTGALVHTLQHQNEVRSVAWNIDGTHLATASEDNTVRIWDAQTGSSVRTLQHQDSVMGVAWKPDDTHLATASRDTIARIWDARTGKLVRALKHQDVVSSIAWSPDGIYLATGCKDKAARIWNAATGRLLYSLVHQKTVMSVAWSHDGTQLATGSFDTTSRIWDIAHIADPKFHTEYENLQAGKLAQEQIMLIHLFDRIRQHQKNDKEISLKGVAQCAQTLGISTAELARALLMFLHPVIMNGILTHYNVSVQRENIEQECEYKALQEAMEPIKACYEAIKKTHEQNAAPLRTPQVIKAALEEYLVDTENYLDSYKTYEEVAKYIEENQKDLNIVLLKSLLEEYIVDEHPIIEQANGTRHE